MTNKNVVGLGGYLRSGKDTVADRLVELHGYTKLGMSDPLLDMALVLDPIIPTPGGMERLTNIVNIVGYVQAKQYPEVRRFLQQLGTEVGRNMIDQDLWVNLASRRIAGILEEGGKVVLTGVRFRNELELVAGRWKGATIWVDRPSVRPPENNSLHASEASLSEKDFQYVMENSSSLQDLYTQTDDWVTS